MSHLSVPVQQFPAIGSAQRVSSDNENSGRKKVILKPGRSLMDWIRYSKSGKDLSGFGRRRIEVTKEELAKHNTEDDCWMVIRGKVYNITPYFEYHPGGVEELMRAAGGDGTKFFDEVQRKQCQNTFCFHTKGYCPCIAHHIMFANENRLQNKIDILFLIIALSYDMDNWMVKLL